jgi:hypothetical protein
LSHVFEVTQIDAAQTWRGADLARRKFRATQFQRGARSKRGPVVATARRD